MPTFSIGSCECCGEGVSIDFCECNWTQATLIIAGLLDLHCEECDCGIPCNCFCVGDLSISDRLNSNLNGTYTTTDLAVVGGFIVATFHLGTEGDPDDRGVLVSELDCDGEVGDKQYCYKLVAYFRCDTGVSCVGDPPEEPPIKHVAPLAVDVYLQKYDACDEEMTPEGPAADETITGFSDDGACTDCADANGTAEHTAYILRCAAPLCDVPDPTFDPFAVSTWELSLT